ncbi:MAG: ferrous iron transport protein A [Halanaerobiales bacterium]|nr:ferrous iron transport protein A [Halanaerobiales bacterium]
MNINIYPGVDLIVEKNIISLADLKAGKKGEVFSFKGGKKLKKKLDSLGIRKGKQIKKVSDMVLKGPITIQIDNSSRVAIGRGMAEKIMVKVIE